MWPVYWTKYDPELNTTRVVHSNSGQVFVKKSTLVFKSLNENDFGVYICSSSNHLGSSEIKLIIDHNGISLSPLQTQTYQADKRLNRLKSNKNKKNKKLFGIELRKNRFKNRTKLLKKSNKAKVKPKY